MHEYLGIGKDTADSKPPDMRKDAMPSQPFGRMVEGSFAIGKPLNAILEIDISGWLVPTAPVPIAVGMRRL